MNPETEQMIDAYNKLGNVLIKKKDWDGAYEKLLKGLELEKQFLPESHKKRQETEKLLAKVEKELEKKKTKSKPKKTDVTLKPVAKTAPPPVDPNRKLLPALTLDAPTLSAPGAQPPAPAQNQTQRTQSAPQPYDPLAQELMRVDWDRPAGFQRHYVDYEWEEKKHKLEDPEKIVGALEGAEAVKKKVANNPAARRSASEPVATVVSSAVPTGVDNSHLNPVGMNTKQNVKMFEALLTLGISKLKAKQYKEAIAKFEEARGLLQMDILPMNHPSKKKLLQNIIKAYEKSGDKEKAAEFQTELKYLKK